MKIPQLQTQRDPAPNTAQLAISSQQLLKRDSFFSTADSEEKLLCSVNIKMYYSYNTKANKLTC
uniref:Uncharacterized protein n=1 Tax=Anguilla anguilla TaxID=7936 RepID=A0A0E9UA05_ANGAN